MICDGTLDGVLTGRLTTVGQELTGYITVVGSGPEYPTYEGPYIVTPLAFVEQTLDTNQKLMDDDVTVLEIPYAEVSNIHGTTVTIAS